jgi:multidrug resistance protein MdtO
MAPIAEARAPRSAFVEFLAVELAPREGRTLAVAHIVVGCVLTVAIAMVFRIPEPTYMAYIVFLVSKDERTATVTTAVGGQIAVTLAILLTLGLMMFDLSEPALRLPAMALYTFVGMYAVRTFTLGPIMYLAGFVLVMLQSVVDDLPSPEALTHLALWLWVVLLVPVLITVVVNLLFGQSVELLTQRTVRKVLSELETAVITGETQPNLARWRELVAPLLSRQPHGPASASLSVSALRRLLDALVILEALPEETAPKVREVLSKEVGASRTLLDEPALERADLGGESKRAGTPVLVAPPSSDTPSGKSAPAVAAFEAALLAFQRELTPSRAPVAPADTHKRPPVVPDAFTNPAYWQFALKTTIAVMIVYFIYTMLDWPGLRTSIVTCFFVALGSVGETVHKLVLRISGALIGGLIAGLCIVFVLPHMTDIGQLSLLIAIVTAGAGWVATGSELLSYAGLQIAFAFFLGVLQDYAPANDLTVLRDRIIGILLGNVVMTLVFTMLWPESATAGLRAALLQAQQAISAVLSRSGDAAQARDRTAQALVRARHFDLVRRFELSMLPRSTSEEEPVTQVADVERAAGEAFVATYDIA